MRVPRRFLVPGTTLVVGGLLITVVALARGRSGVVNATEAEGRMPSIDRPALGGGRVTPDDFRGKVTLVNFWASWCAPCRQEQPGIQRLSEELDEVAFLGVNFQDDRASALTYIEEFGVTYPSVADPDALLAHRFGVPFLPATVLVDASGEMRYRLVGAQTETALRRHLEELLAE